MDWKSVLKTGLKKTETTGFARICLGNKKDTDALIVALKGSDKTVARKAAWVVSTLAELDKDAVSLYAEDFIDVIVGSDDYSVIREILKIFLLIVPPANAEGKLIDSCFRFILQPASDTAVKYTSMRIISRAAKRYPELNSELKECLHTVMPNVTAPLQWQMKKLIAKMK